MNEDHLTPETISVVDPLKPPVSLLVKLGSALVHVAEALGVAETQEVASLAADFPREPCDDPFEEPDEHGEPWWL